MGKVIRLIQRWFNMAAGKSAVAVEQGMGRCFRKDEIRGYYNDLTGKVSPATLLDEQGVPYNIASSGQKVYSLVTISQYALGCYDLFLLREERAYLERFLKLAERILDSQQDDGKWDARQSIGSKLGNSSCMAQGQGCSILLRAYLVNHDERYRLGAEKAIRFMLRPTAEGGTAVYCGHDVTLEKYPPQDGCSSSVLNGWIFALFGLYDFILFSGSEDCRIIWERSCRTLEQALPRYDRKYWSNYDLIGTIASPAYNRVHVSLLLALSQLSGSEAFSAYATRFDRYSKSRWNTIRAVLRKTVQKLTTPADAFLVQ